MIGERRRENRFFNRPKHPLVFALSFAAFCGVWAAWIALDIGCVFLNATSLPCISCGMSRAVICAARLDLVGAFSYHPMFWSLPIVAWYLATEMKPIRNKAVNLSLIGTILGGFVISYIVKIINIL